MVRLETMHMEAEAYEKSLDITLNIAVNLKLL